LGEGVNVTHAFQQNQVNTGWHGNKQNEVNTGWPENQQNKVKNRVARNSEK